VAATAGVVAVVAALVTGVGEPPEGEAVLATVVPAAAASAATLANTAAKLGAEELWESAVLWDVLV
jgi:hypothetical protein